MLALLRKRQGLWQTTQQITVHTCAGSVNVKMAGYAQNYTREHRDASSWSASLTIASRRTWERRRANLLFTAAEDRLGPSTVPRLAFRRGRVTPDRLRAGYHPFGQLPERPVSCPAGQFMSDLNHQRHGPLDHLEDDNQRETTYQASRSLAACCITRVCP